MHSPTPQQLAIYEAAVGGASHVLVEALAGCGKTTTAVEAARRAPRGRTGFVAFNKHIAAELQRRLGPSAAASTLHSLGYAALRRRLPGVQLDERKPERLLRELRPEWFWTNSRNQVKPRDEARSVLQLASLAKYTLAAEDDAALASVADHYGVELAGRPGDGALFEACRLLLKACADDTDTIDFDDMVWLPVRLELMVGGFDLLLVDESQDLGRCQQALAKAAVGGGRMVVIGDARQAIYGFSGSDDEAMSRLAGELEGTGRGLARCPLTVTWRCPRSHVALARRVVPELEAAPGAAEGEVLEVAAENVYPFCLPDALVVCRRNGPLVSLAMQLIARGVPALMRGRDIGRGLLDLVDRLRPRDVADLVGLLADYLDRETERLERRQAPESALESVRDRVACLSAVAARHRTVQELRDFVAGLFGDESPDGKCWLSSVHRAKGLEADRVVVLEPETLPMVRRDAPAWQNRQEWNLLYIALTRSKRQLVFAGRTPAALEE